MVGCAARVSVTNFSVTRKQNETVVITSNPTVFDPPKSSSADEYCNQGLAYSYQNNSAQAIACYKKALEINPNHYWANNYIGYEYLRKGDYALSIPYLQKAMEIQPDNPFAYNYMGGICVFMGQYNYAIDYCQKAIGIRDQYNANLQGRPTFDSGEPYFFMALAYAGLEDEDTAISHLITAARLGDENAQALLMEIENDAQASPQWQTPPAQQRQTPPAQNTLKKDPNFKID